MEKIDTKMQNESSFSEWSPFFNKDYTTKYINNS